MTTARRGRGVAMRPRAALGAVLVALGFVCVAEWLRGSGTASMAIAVSVLLLVAVAIVAHAVQSTMDHLTQRALHDPLTGMANRSTFYETLVSALERRRPDGLIAVIYLDLDGFKAVNDLRGHHTGDRLLVLVAQRLVQCLREKDLAARVGGDEFAVLLEGLDDAREADAVAELILESLVRPFAIDGAEVRVRASIGVALCTPGSDTADSLLDRADTAMYSAKSHGRNRVALFDPTMLESRRARLELEFILHDAVALDRIRIHFQPVVDLHTGVITGFEALARWSDDRLGAVNPEAFIAAAEATGLIRVLGVQLLERAHAGARQLVRAAGRPLSLAVNLSSEQVTDADLADRISELRVLDPDVQLVLELTESVLLEDDIETLRALEDLKVRGVRLAIDDFGKGFSSLGYLDRLPVDILKIDKSFVAKLPNPRSTSVVRGIVAMAHSMGLRLVCEGIENITQLEALRDLDCNTGQGYYFAPALDLPSALALIARGPLDLTPPVMTYREDDYARSARP